MNSGYDFAVKVCEPVFPPIGASPNRSRAHGKASSASGFFIVVRAALYALAAERQALGSAEALWRDLAPRARPKLRNQIVLIQFHFTAVLFRTVPG